MAKLSEVINQLNEENKIPEDEHEKGKREEILRYIHWFEFHYQVQKIKAEQLNKPTEEEKKQKLGSLVSKVCEWSGSDIFDVLQLALEDSNYHTENKSVTKLREQLKLQTEMEYCKNI